MTLRLLVLRRTNRGITVMTEEKQEKDLAYLQGKVEALEDTLDLLMQFMPNIVLMRVKQTLGLSIAATERLRDEDPAHKNWDMAMRSYNIPENTPFVTRYATGMIDALTRFRESSEGALQRRAEEENFPGFIAQTPQGDANEALDRQYREEFGDD
jgi:hypothetical protein